jgi:hypothetical protein
MPMKNKVFLELLFIVFVITIFSSSVQAFYKKKVLIKKFQNPVNWDKTYKPDKIIFDLLRQELINQKRVQLISISEKKQKMMEKAYQTTEQNYEGPDTFDSKNTSLPEVGIIQNFEPQTTESQQNTTISKVDGDFLWPAKLGEKLKKPTFIKIQGKIIDFKPNNKNSSVIVTPSLHSLNRENAEIKVHVELVENNTGKILFKKMFKAYSDLGTKPFSLKDPSLKDIKNSSSSLNLALNSLKNSVASFIYKKLESLPLEGEIIAIQTKEVPQESDEKEFFVEEIMINIGSLNGVRIGDFFQVDEVGLRIKDIYTERNLGNVYVKTGVIQILQVWEGTAKAIPIAGTKFETGFLIRSYKFSRKGELDFHNKPNNQDIKKSSWWDFHGITSVN